LALTIAGAWLAGLAAARWGGLPVAVAAAIGAIVAVALVAGLRFPLDRVLLLQVAFGWSLTRACARGAPTDYDRAIETCAQRIVAAARDGTADEVLVRGQRAGGMTGTLTVGRALWLEP